MKKYLLALLLTTAAATSCYLCTKETKVLFSIPRVNEDLRLCLLPNGLMVEFDTGSDLCTIPSDVLKQFDSLGYNMEHLKADVNLRYIDGSRRHFEEAVEVKFPITEDYYSTQIFLEEPPTPMGLSSFILGRSAIGDNVLCYFPDHLELRTEKPSGYDIVIPITIKGNEPYLRIKVNGQENNYLLDTGFSGGICLPVEDTVYAVSKVRPIRESSWFAGKVVNDNEFD